MTTKTETAEYVEYQNDDQIVRVVIDPEGDLYALIYDNFNRVPLVELDSYQAEQLIKTLQAAVKDMTE
jgi:hypothetical protein